MRRALERCTYPGYWTTDESCNLIGVGTKYTYRFEKIPRPQNLFNVNCYKQNSISKRETRILAYCNKNLSVKEANKLISQFCDWVVNNAE
jgi:hypothetical protein